MPSSSRRFWSRLGFGSVPGDAEENRAFLQKRIVFFTGMVGLLWLAVSVSSMGSAMLFMPSLLTGPAAARAGAVHNAGTLGLLLCWFICRRVKLSLPALNALDAGVIVAQACVMSLIMDAVDIRFRPDLNMTLGLVCTLIGRAAVIPSNGARTLAVGVLAVLPVMIATYHTHAGLPEARRLMPPAMAVSQIANWMAFALLLSTSISRIIYGLSARVQQAQRLGQYTLERKIGAGAMGEVYLARHALLRRPTAVKLLAPGREGQDALARFEREVQATSGLRHPNTVAIYDYGRTPEGIFYYAMEYLDGVDLERLIASDGPQPEGRVVHILSQIAGALDEAHSAGLIHRDIKPSNILLCDHGHEPDFAKVLDFGLVKDSAADAPGHSGTATLTGTPLYMSPEAITAPSTIDARSDLYALGAVAYALLTGAPPFSGRTSVEVYGHHLHPVAAPPSQRRALPLHPEVERIVLDCLAKDRAQRPASAAALAERLAANTLPPWTKHEARAWWNDRGAGLRSLRAAPVTDASTGATVIVDLDRRQ